jgi:hypothetical protein
LIGHGFALLPTEGDIGLARIKAIDIAGEGNDLNSIQEFVRGIIADNNGRTLFPGFSAN